MDVPAIERNRRMSAYDDLVERIAKAVFGVTIYADDPTRAGMPTWEEATPEHVTYCEECAQAVLSSLHAAGLRIVPSEATQEMCHAARDTEHMKSYTMLVEQEGERLVGAPVSAPIHASMLAYVTFAAMIAASPYAPKDK
jgi:hypothetical protein